MVWAWAGSMDVVMVWDMDALATGWTGSMDLTMVWAWMHWPIDGLVAWMVSWFGHG